MKKQILLALSFICFFSAAAIAKEFSYDYIQVGIGTSNSKHIDNDYYVSISKPVSENIFLKGRIENSYGDWNDPGEYEEQDIDGYAIEAGYNNTVNLSTDFIASLEFLRLDLKLTCTPTTGTCGTYSDATPSYNYLITKVGIRKQISEKTNMEAILKNNRLSGSSLGNQLEFNIARDISDNYSIGLEYDLGLGSITTNYYGVFLRSYF